MAIERPLEGLRSEKFQYSIQAAQRLMIKATTDEP